MRISRWATFGRDENVGQSLIEIIKGDWMMQRDECGQTRWEEFPDSGLVKKDAVYALADQVWAENDDETPRRSASGAMKTFVVTPDFIYGGAAWTMIVRAETPDEAIKVLAKGLSLTEDTGRLRKRGDDYWIVEQLTELDKLQAGVVSPLKRTCWLLPISSDKMGYRKQW
jgi:hypothetical protein